MVEGEYICGKYEESRDFCGKNWKILDLKKLKWVYLDFCLNPWNWLRKLGVSWRGWKFWVILGRIMGDWLGFLKLGLEFVKGNRGLERGRSRFGKVNRAGLCLILPEVCLKWARYRYLTCLGIDTEGVICLRNHLYTDTLSTLLLVPLKLEPLGSLWYRYLSFLGIGIEIVILELCCFFILTPEASKISFNSP